MGKVLSWYDNEWGYSTRLVDLGVLVATKYKEENKWNYKEIKNIDIAGKKYL